MPMGQYKDFGECVRKQKEEGHDEESAKRICGYIKKKTEDNGEES